jgi:alginate O-acetyltransferase complex protein AlgI
VLFHSLQFLLFLPVAFMLYWFACKTERAKKIVLVVASLVFYMAWNPLPVLFLIHLVIVSWGMGRLLVRTHNNGLRKLWLAISIINHVGMLGTFKYADWLAQSFVDGMATFNVHITYAPIGLVLPVGLSFIVFQGLSYTIDIYRRELMAKDSLLDVMVFMTFFPHVVAGPIVRAHDFVPQLELRKRLTDNDGARALFRIAQGMVKKLVIADMLSANLIDRVFAAPANYSGLEVTVAVFAYTLQIYFDFSAYSDIAIGSARLFGYELKENFDKPYLATNIAEFWRRWHMSLGSWLRDYVYIPLGGNREGHARSMIFLLVTMTIGGLWHGAHGKYVLWGFLHGLLLVATRMWWQRFGRMPTTPALSIVSMMLTFVVVVELRILFRARDLADAHTIFQAQFHHWQSSQPWATGLPTSLIAVMILAVVGHIIPHRFYHAMADAFARLPWILRAVLLVAVAVAVQQVAQTEAQPFIYARF